jgi:hypothetical protein
MPRWRASWPRYTVRSGRKKRTHVIPAVKNQAPHRNWNAKPLNERPGPRLPSARSIELTTRLRHWRRAVEQRYHKRDPPAWKLVFSGNVAGKGTRVIESELQRCQARGWPPGTRSAGDVSTELSLVFTRT